MKSKIHLATKEYCFIEIEVEAEKNDTPEYLVEKSVLVHDKLALAINQNEGLNTLDWAKVRDTYILKGDIDPLDYEALNKWQKLVVSEVRKSFNKAKRE